MDSRATRGTRAASGHRRPILWFWGLVVVAVLATGALTSAWAAPAAPLTGLKLAVSGLVLITAVALAIRIMVALDKARR